MQQLVVGHGSPIVVLEIFYPLALPAVTHLQSIYAEHDINNNISDNNVINQCYNFRFQNI